MACPSGRWRGAPSARSMNRDPARIGCRVVRSPGREKRVPGDVRGTINAYLAMRAALIAILEHNQGNPRRIANVAVPGLGTGVGWMSADEASVQMRAAYDMIVSGGWRGVVHAALAPFAL